jgi:hypothetical protein
MGLDMYLFGEEHADYSKRFEDGHAGKITLAHTTYQLGYWRKHPNLHGYIVNTFADGVDECQRISLGVEDLRAIIEATKNHSLPDTKGCFFGASRTEDDADTIRIIERAIGWLHDGQRRSIYYEASW